MYNFYEIRVESMNEALKAMKGICQLLILMLIMLLLHELPCIMNCLVIEVWMFHEGKEGMKVGSSLNSSMKGELLRL